jgi:hypothetical protein
MLILPDRDFHVTDARGIDRATGCGFSLLTCFGALCL